MPKPHLLAVLMYFDPSKKKYYARRYKRPRSTAKVLTNDPFEDPAEISQSFDFTAEMLGNADEGDVEIEASGWADLYDPPVVLQLGTPSPQPKNMNAPTNWPGPKAVPARRVDFTFVKGKGGKADLKWTLQGGSSGSRPFQPGKPNEIYGILVTLAYDKGMKGRLSFSAKSPWGKVSHDHP